MIDVWKSLVALSGAVGLLYLDTARAASLADFYGISTPEQLPIISADESESFAPQVKLPVKVVLSKAVHVRKDRIILGDVASCIGSTTLCEEVNSIDLGKSPIPGGSMRLKKEEIYSMVGAEIKSAEVHIESPEFVRVIADCQLLSDGDVTKVLVELMSSEVETPLPFQIAVQKAILPSGIKLRPGPYRVEFDRFVEESSKALSRRSGSVSDNMNFSVLISSIDGQWEALRADVKFKVEVSTQVAIAARDLKKGEVLVEGDVNLAWAERKKAPFHNYESKESLKGLVPRQFIRKGEILQGSQLEVNRIVKRGDPVKVRLRLEGLDMQSTGTALDNGGQGDHILVAVGRLKKKFEAKIIEKSLVEVIN